MIKFTKEEISPCKQIAERHKKEIEECDYVIGFWTEGWRKDFGDVIGRLKDKRLGEVKVAKDSICYPDKIIPLLTISDCLEFLWKEKKRDIISLATDFPATAKRVWRIVTVTEEHWGDTPLEACLKAVLAVIKERK